MLQNTAEHLRIRPIKFVLFFLLIIGSIGFAYPSDLESLRIEIEKLTVKIDPYDHEKHNPIKGTGDPPPVSPDLEKILPPIDALSRLVVDPTINNSAVTIEIYSSTEKSGEKNEGWLADVGREFNRRNVLTSEGNLAKVKIRRIPSGLAYQYIVSNKINNPYAFTPSNEIWGSMVSSKGIQIRLMQDRLVHNLAGIAIKKTKSKKFDNLDFNTLIKEILNGELNFGYANPYQSSTALNFLVTVLQTFANESNDHLTSSTVKTKFRDFESKIRDTLDTTIHRRNMVMHDDDSEAIDAFVIEYQTFASENRLKREYDFVPFGFSHNNPLYAIGNFTDEENEVLEEFAELANSETFASLASKANFNPNQYKDFKPTNDMPDGKTLVEIQKLWKNNKDYGIPISAVFLCDVSDSMGGESEKEKIAEVRKALISGSHYIQSRHSIGLVTFSNEVRKLLPIKPFKSGAYEHRDRFLNAASNYLTTTGQTAMYSGIAVALEMLIKQKINNPNTILKLFILTDGWSNIGLEYKNVESAIRGMGISIHIIGFKADKKELEDISQTLENPVIRANPKNIEYIIADLFNSNL